MIDLLRATIDDLPGAGVRGDAKSCRFWRSTRRWPRRQRRVATNVVLGGERGGKRIDGFDLGNSPSEYTPTAVGGRRVFITTTNGTRALHHARLARACSSARS